MQCSLSCGGSSYCIGLGENHFTGIVSCQLWRLFSYQISACSESLAEIHRQLCHVYGPNIMSDSVVRWWYRKFTEGCTSVHDEDHSGQSALVMNWWKMCGKQFCRTGSSQFLNSVVKFPTSDNCMNLAVGGKLYQYSHFLLALCNNCCHHKTETALHYSHGFPLYCFVCTFPSD